MFVASKWPWNAFARRLVVSQWAISKASSSGDSSTACVNVSTPPMGGGSGPTMSRRGLRLFGDTRPRVRAARRRGFGSGRAPRVERHALREQVVERTATHVAPVARHHPAAERAHAVQLFGTHELEALEHVEAEAGDER